MESNKTPLYDFQISRKYIKFLVFPRFQFLLIGVNLGVTLLVSLMVFIQMKTALANLKLTAGISGREAEVFKQFVDYQSQTFQTSLFMALGAGLIASTILTLWASHRFAGPLIRLRSYFQQINQGETPSRPISFRDGDYLSDLPPIINGALKKLRETPSGHGQCKRCVEKTAETQAAS